MDCNVNFLSGVVVVKDGVDVGQVCAALESGFGISVYPVEGDGNPEIYFEISDDFEYREAHLGNVLHGLAPLIDSGEIEYEGAGGHRWKHVLMDGVWKQLQGKIVYSNPTDLPWIEKNEKDVEILNGIIRQQGELGTKLPEALKALSNLDSPRYTWDENGRIAKINWSFCDLKGEISFAGLDALEHLEVVKNQLEKLDISGCYSLKTLHCEGNMLTWLDASGLAALENLYCHDNQMVSLHVDGCTLLEGLNCQSNRITGLDVSGLRSLKYLFCKHNQLESLGLSGCTALERLDCVGNMLTALDLGDCIAMEGLTCWKNKLASLNVTSCSNLIFLDCKENPMESLTLGTHPKLKTLEKDDVAINFEEETDYEKE